MLDPRGHRLAAARCLRSTHSCFEWPSGSFRPIADITISPDKFAVNGNTVTIAGGALVGLLAVAVVFFRRVEGRSRVDTLIGMLGNLGLGAGLVGWLLMWFTEEAIWSPPFRTCDALASIELKGQVYRNCSYLVHRYEAGEWLFVGGLAAVVVSFALSSLSKRQT